MRVTLPSTRKFSSAGENSCQTNTRCHAWKWQSLSCNITNLPYLQQEKIHYAIQKHFTYYNKVFCSNRLCQGGTIFWSSGGSASWLWTQANEESEFHAKPRLGLMATLCVSTAHFQDRVQWRALENTIIKFRTVRRMSWTAAPSAVQGLFFMELQ